MHEGIRPPKYRDGQAAQGTIAPQTAAVQTDLPKRPERKPFGSMQLKMAYEKREGFHDHWFNDIPGRIDRATEAGYEHVKDKDGKNVSRVVGTSPEGGPLTAYLMRIPEEWYSEDMKLEQAIIEEREELMRRGKFEAPEKGYVGQQGITIRQGN